MITENVSVLKIHKLTQEQYDREYAAGTIEPNAIYLTPDPTAVYIPEILEDTVSRCNLYSDGTVECWYYGTPSINSDGLAEITVPVKLDTTMRNPDKLGIPIVQATVYGNADNLCLANISFTQSSDLNKTKMTLAFKNHTEGLCVANIHIFGRLAE